MTKEIEGSKDGSSFDAVFEKELKERIADFEKPDYDYGTTFNKKDAFAAVGLLALGFALLVGVMIVWGI